MRVKIVKGLRGQIVSSIDRGCGCGFKRIERLRMGCSGLRSQVYFAAQAGTAVFSSPSRTVTIQLTRDKEVATRTHDNHESTSYHFIISNYARMAWRCGS